MNVLVERYQRRKYVNQEDSQMLYYVRQKSGTVRVMDVNKLADAIEANSSLTAGDVKHSIEAFVEQLRLSLTQGDKVKIDGLGTFHITLSSDSYGQYLPCNSDTSWRNCWRIHHICRCTSSDRCRYYKRREFKRDQQEFCYGNRNCNNRPYLAVPCNLRRCC